MDYNKTTLLVICAIGALNAYFLYKYSTLEYSISTDTEVIIRKLISIEELLKEEK